MKKADVRPLSRFVVNMRHAPVVIPRPRPSAGPSAVEIQANRLREQIQKLEDERAEYVVKLQVEPWQDDLEAATSEVDWEEQSLKAKLALLQGVQRSVDDKRRACSCLELKITELRLEVDRLLSESRALQMHVDTQRIEIVAALKVTAMERAETVGAQKKIGDRLRRRCEKKCRELESKIDRLRSRLGRILGEMEERNATQGPAGNGTSEPAPEGDPGEPTSEAVGGGPGGDHRKTGGTGDEVV
jgi:hypothetical protein